MPDLRMGDRAKGEPEGWSGKRRRGWNERKINEDGSKGGGEGGGEIRRGFRSSRARYLSLACRHRAARVAKEEDCAFCERMQIISRVLQVTLKPTVNEVAAL